MLVLIEVLNTAFLVDSLRSTLILVFILNFRSLLVKALSIQPCMGGESRGG